MSILKKNAKPKLIQKNRKKKSKKGSSATTSLAITGSVESDTAIGKGYGASRSAKDSAISPLMNKGNDGSPTSIQENKKRYFTMTSSKTERKKDRIRIEKLEKKKDGQKFQIKVAVKPQKKGNETNIPHNLNLLKVKQSISAMLKFEESKSKLESKNPLFVDDARPVHLTVQCIRVPKMKISFKNIRLRLAHPLVDNSSSVCFFVPNLKKGTQIDHEPTVEHYSEILKQHDIKGISQVIPLRQIEVEYDTFELRRRLVSQFDVFLADGRITGHVQGLLGKEIRKRRKLPVPVDMKVKNLKKEFDSALRKTVLTVDGKGRKFGLKVGHTKQSIEELAENIESAAEGLAERFPGGWKNIRSLEIHLQDSASVPVYLSLRNSNDVKVPVVEPVLPKKAVPVEGELTTIPGAYVTVMPSGEVIVKKKLTKEDRAMGFTESDFEDDTDEEMDEGSDEETGLEEKKTEPVIESEEQEDTQSNSDADSDAGNEHVAEAAEVAYLSEWRQQWNENIDENIKRRKHKDDDENLEDGHKGKKLKVVKHSSKKQKANKVNTKEKIKKKNAKNHEANGDVEGASKRKGLGELKHIKQEQKVNTATKSIKKSHVDNKAAYEELKITDQETEMDKNLEVKSKRKKFKKEKKLNKTAPEKPEMDNTNLGGKSKRKKFKKEKKLNKAAPVNPEKELVPVKVGKKNKKARSNVISFGEEKEQQQQISKQWGLLRPRKDKNKLKAKKSAVGLQRNKKISV